VNNLTVFLLCMEYLGTVAFAVSGAAVGLKKHLDIFGVAVLGLVTATGGGLIRDVILNVTPPAVFRTPIFAAIAVVTSLILFLPPIRNATLKSSRTHDLVLFWADSLGLAAFTVSALRTVMSIHPGGSVFFYSFLAVITGVGGGLLRDVMVQEIPFIFVKKVYAVAALAGALAALALWPLSPLWGSVAGFLLVLTIRFLAMHFRWNLPRA